MSEWLGQLSVLTWLLIFVVATMILRKLLDRISLPKPPRRIVDWPDRSARHVHRFRAPRSSSQTVSGVQPRRPGINEFEVEAPSVAAVRAFRMLRVVTLRDVPAIERLIQYELQRAPGISRDEAICRAYERWIQDNR